MMPDMNGKFGITQIDVKTSKLSAVLVLIHIARTIKPKHPTQ
jgi:hypothetical protein